MGDERQCEDHQAERDQSAAENDKTCHGTIVAQPREFLLRDVLFNLFQLCHGLPNFCQGLTCVTFCHILDGFPPISGLDRVNQPFFFGDKAHHELLQLVKRLLLCRREFGGELFPDCDNAFPGLFIGLQIAVILRDDIAAKGILEVDNEPHVLSRGFLQPIEIVQALFIL